jgi:hypothetical protein
MIGSPVCVLCGQGSKLKPKHVLRTYQAVHELKKELAKKQEEVGQLVAELNSTTKGLIRDAELQKVSEEAERLQKALPAPPAPALALQLLRSRRCETFRHCDPLPTHK